MTTNTILLLTTFFINSGWFVIFSIFIQSQKQIESVFVFDFFAFSDYFFDFVAFDKSNYHDQ